MNPRFRTGETPSRTAEYMALFRAIETAERPERRLFDDPYAATQNAKRARADSATRASCPKCPLRAHRFRKGQPRKRLRALRFRCPRSDTPPAVDQNFRMLASILAHSSRLIFTYVHRGALDGSIAFPEARRWTSSVGSAAEPFIFWIRPRGVAR